MSSSNLHNEWTSSYLSGGSMAYVDSLYEDYLADPDSVPADWQAIFKQLAPNGAENDRSHREVREHFLENANKPRTYALAPESNHHYQIADLVHDYRSLGHLAARLDPLAMMQRPRVPNLELAYHELDQLDKNQTFFSGTHFNGPEMPLGEIYKALQETYCGSIGIEYMHIADPQQTEWWQQRMEEAHGRPKFNSAKKLSILKDLIAADGLERYLGTRYVGQKRFSLEGGDALIPLMKELINNAGRDGVKELVIGMAHRGRLNVLVNVLGKDPKELFQEFEGKVSTTRTGDVKYHLGFSSDIQTESGAILHLALAFNPSHLEIIGPVVEGSARSRLRKRDDMDKKEKVVPIVIHGDAAFSGQGVVMETFNFSQARGYCTGGTIHLVINNQVGFTTSDPRDSRSTLYCTDIAKMVQAPVLHVNGDDPEAVVFATQLAFDFRMRFKRDVVIDLFCYRRNGHNEADEPAVTQPEMYKKIKTMPPLRELYAKELIKEGLLTAEDEEEYIEKYRQGLDEGKPVVNVVYEDYEGKYSLNWLPYIDAKWTDKADTTINKNLLQQLSQQLNTPPAGFTLHPVVQRMLAEREKMTAGEIR